MDYETDGGELVKPVQYVEVQSVHKHCSRGFSHVDHILIVANAFILMPVSLCAGHTSLKAAS